ncbi:MAG: hypothetical protein WC515_08815, partial [Candidatus Omnitrophota bacterium]
EIISPKEPAKTPAEEYDNLNDIIDNNPIDDQEISDGSKMVALLKFLGIDTDMMKGVREWKPVENARAIMGKIRDMVADFMDNLVAISYKKAAALVLLRELAPVIGQNMDVAMKLLAVINPEVANALSRLSEREREDFLAAFAAKPLDRSRNLDEQVLDAFIGHIFGLAEGKNLATARIYLNAMTAAVTPDNKDMVLKILNSRINSALKGAGISEEFNQALKETVGEIISPKEPAKTPAEEYDNLNDIIDNNPIDDQEISDGSKMVALLRFLGIDTDMMKGVREWKPVKNAVRILDEIRRLSGKWTLFTLKSAIAAAFLRDLAPYVKQNMDVAMKLLAVINPEVANALSRLSEREREDFLAAFAGMILDPSRDMGEQALEMFINHVLGIAKDKGIDDAARFTGIIRALTTADNAELMLNIVKHFDCQDRTQETVVANIIMGTLEETMRRSPDNTDGGRMHDILRDKDVRAGVKLILMLRFLEIEPSAINAQGWLKDRDEVSKLMDDLEQFIALFSEREDLAKILAAFALRNIARINVDLEVRAKLLRIINPDVVRALEPFSGAEKNDVVDYIAASLSPSEDLEAQARDIFINKILDMTGMAEDIYTDTHEKYARAIVALVTPENEEEMMDDMKAAMEGASDFKLKVINAVIRDLQLRMISGAFIDREGALDAMLRDGTMSGEDKLAVILDLFGIRIDELNSVRGWDVMAEADGMMTDIRSGVSSGLSVEKAIASVLLNRLVYSPQGELAVRLNMALVMRLIRKIVSPEVAKEIDGLKGRAKEDFAVTFAMALGKEEDIDAQAADIMSALAGAAVAPRETGVTAPVAPEPAAVSLGEEAGEVLTEKVPGTGRTVLSSSAVGIAAVWLVNPPAAYTIAAAAAAIYFGYKIYGSFKNREAVSYQTADKELVNNVLSVLDTVEFEERGAYDRAREGLVGHISMAGKGRLIEGQNVTVTVGDIGRTVTSGDIGERALRDIAMEIARDLPNPEMVIGNIEEALREFNGALPYEIAFAVMPDGTVQYSTRSDIRFDNEGRLMQMSCTETVLPGARVLFRGHTHPDVAGTKGQFAKDMENLNEGRFGDISELVIFQGQTAVVERLARTPAAAIAAAYGPAHIIYRFDARDGAFIETIEARPLEMVEIQGADLAKEGAGITAEIAPPVAPVFSGAALAPPAKRADLIPGAASLSSYLDEGGTAALVERIRELKDSGVMTGAFVAAPHIDTLADENGDLLNTNTGLKEIAGVAATNGDLLKVVILVEGARGFDRAVKAIGKIPANKAITIIDISQRGSQSVAAYAAQELGGGIPCSNIGMSFTNTPENRKTIESEFGRHLRESASVVLVDKEVLASDKPQTAYLDVVNAINAAVTRKVNFLGLLKDSGDTGVIDLINKLQDMLHEAFVFKIITDVGRELADWIRSVNAAAVSA